ncbi:cation/cationic drug transporter [Spongiibacter sp. IMCC21906]|nr:cation/cationic drug transporter [Spongiibacter sp. IMCC21906]
MGYWLLLLLAVLFEIAWAMSMKWFSKQPGIFSGITVFLLAFAIISLLSFALRGIPMGTAYAIWTGLGAVGVTVCGVIWFGEAISPVRLACIGLIIIGAAGLKLTA